MVELEGGGRAPLVRGPRLCCGCAAAGGRCLPARSLLALGLCASLWLDAHPGYLVLPDPSTGVVHTGWLKDGDHWYYLTRSGAMVTGARWIDGTRYVFDAQGRLQE